MIQFCFQPKQLGKTARSWAQFNRAELCWLAGSLAGWLADWLATRLVGYKRGPKECSPKTSLAYSLWTQQRQQCLEYNNVQRIFYASVFKILFFLFFFLYLVFCLQLQQQQVNQILFNELAPTFDPLPPRLLRYWHASTAPSGKGARLVCQKIQRDSERERKIESLDDMWIPLEEMPDDQYRLLHSCIIITHFVIHLVSSFLIKLKGTYLIFYSFPHASFNVPGTWCTPSG